MGRAASSIQHALLTAATAAVALLALACPRQDLAPPAPSAALPLPELRRLSVDTGGYSGLSDLTVDGDGQFWSVPERGRVLLQLSLGAAAPAVVGAPVPIAGLGGGVDTEGLAWMGPGAFAIGTETHSSRGSDDVLIATVQQGQATITERIPLPYSLWGLQAEPNRGIEGVCYVDGHLIAASETTGLRDGKRFAPLARYDAASRTWIPSQLLLSTTRGKISALACRNLPAEQRVEVLAIERHYDVSRLLRFRLSPKAPGGDITPTVLVDFGTNVANVPNLEGVSWGTGDTLFVLSDNDSGGAAGPTQAFVFANGAR